MNRQQAKFYLSAEAVDKLRARAKATGYNMSTLLNMLILEHIPNADAPAHPAVAPRTPAAVENPVNDYNPDF